MQQTPRHPTDADRCAGSRSPMPAAGQRRHVVGCGRDRRRRRLLRSVRPATVWPCLGQGRPDGIGLLASWLHTAIVKIVTTYTQPGDRVLLLSAPTIVAAAPPGLPGSQRSSLSEFAGLSEAAWTVARLGRRIQTWTGGPPSATGSPEPTDPPQPESGLGPITARPKSTSTQPADSAALDTNADRYDLIITAVVPQATDWVATVPWTNVLRPNGTLAVITHSDIESSRLHDPTGALVATIRDRGLAWLDHVVLLKTPIAATASHSAPLTATDRWVPSRHTRVHDDLLLFTAVRPEATEGAGSDE